MNEFSKDALARRLATLELSEPDPRALSARVLARASARRVPRPLALSAIGALTAALLLVATTAGAYFAPAFSQALADGPIGGFAGGLLRGTGLASHTDRITSLDDRAVGAGVTLDLVGGYADGARTIILVRTTPPSYIGSAGAHPSPILRDQFGQTYHQRSAAGSVESGENVLEFEPLRWPASAVGARLTLEVRGAERSASDVIAGQWELRGTLAVDDGTDLATPAPIDIGGIRFEFTRVRAFPTVLAVDARVTGAIDLLTARVPDGAKGTPVVDIALLDRSGNRLPLVSGSAGSSDRPGVAARWLWAAEGSGPYTLRITVAGEGSAERAIGR